MRHKRNTTVYSSKGGLRPRPSPRHQIELPDELKPTSASAGMLPSPGVSSHASPIMTPRGGGGGGTGGDGGTHSSGCFSNTNSATLTLVDLAGCEAASLNTVAYMSLIGDNSEIVVSQGGATALCESITKLQTLADSPDKDNCVLAAVTAPS